VRRLLDYAEEEIARRIREGAKMAVEALSAALTEEPKAESIREISSRIHELHYEISDLVMEAVARYSPVATDLRFLKGALFVSYDIYRVARYAYDIAVVVEKLGSGCWSRRVVEVGEVVKRMVSTSVEMFLNKDISRLKEVEELDDNVVDKAYELIGVK